MKIRSFESSDTKAVTALWLESFPDDPPHNAPTIVIAHKLQYQPELFFVAEIDGNILGTVLSGYDGHRGWLYSVAVHEKAKRQGIGTKLIRHAEQELTAMGCTKTNLQVRSTNATVVAFYSSLGYTVEERISMGKRYANTAFSHGT